MFASLSLLPLPSSFRENEREKEKKRARSKRPKEKESEKWGKIMLSIKTIGILLLASGALLLGYLVTSVHMVAGLGPLLASGVLISLALVTREIDEGVSADDYKIYTYFVAAIGAVAMAEVLFSASKLITITKETGLDFYLEISLGLIVSISAIVIYHMVTMLYSLSPRSVPKMKGGGGGGRDGDEDNED
jgi:hypothetical protein